MIKTMDNIRSRLTGKLNTYITKIEQEAGHPIKIDFAKHPSELSYGLPAKCSARAPYTVTIAPGLGQMLARRTAETIIAHEPKLER